MEIKDWEGMIAYTEVGSYCFVTLQGASDVRRAYSQVRRAEGFGYEICLTKLYGGRFYFEKLKEGRRDAYLNRRK